MNLFNKISLFLGVILFFLFFYSNFNLAEASTINIGETNNIYGFTSQYYKDPRIKIDYKMTIYNETKNQYLSNGDIVEVGSRLKFLFINSLSHFSLHSVWADGKAATGGSLSGLFGLSYSGHKTRTYQPDYWVPQNQSGTNDSTKYHCNASGYTGYYNSGASTIYYWVRLAIEEPNYSITHSGTAGLNCNSNGTDCSVTSSGTINTRVSVSPTQATFWRSSKIPQVFGPAYCSNERIATVNVSNPNTVTNISLTAQNPTAALTLTANPTTIWQGESSTLTYSGTNIVSGSCSINNNVGSVVNISGTRQASPTTTTTYTITCTRLSAAGGGDITAQETVTVFSNPTADLKVNDQDNNITINLGQSIKLTWSSTNADYCTGTNFSTGNAVSNSVGFYFQPNSNTTYTLTCYRTLNGVTRQGTDQITVNVTQPPTPIVTLTTNKLNVWPTGDPATLSWSGSNINSCNFTAGLNESNVGVSNSRIVQPTNTIIYTISCTGAGGTTVNSSVTITVHTPPTADLKIKKSTDSTYVDGPITINNGQLINLQWSSTGANACSGSGPGFSTSGTSGTTGNITPPISTATTYGVSCWKTLPRDPENNDPRDNNERTRFGSDTAVANSDILPATLTLTASASPILQGQSSTLTWNGTNIESGSCVLTSDKDNNVKNLSVSNPTSSRIVQPTNTTVYTITCNRTAAAGGTPIVADATIIVDVNIILPIVDIKVNNNDGPDAVWADNSQITLVWNSQNTNSCVVSNSNTVGLTNGFLNVSSTNGSAIVKPESSNKVNLFDIVYTITCNSLNDPTVKVSDAVAISVVPPPVVDVKIYYPFLGTTGDGPVGILEGRLFKIIHSTINTRNCVKKDDSLGWVDWTQSNIDWAQSNNRRVILPSYNTITPYRTVYGMRCDSTYDHLYGIKPSLYQRFGSDTAAVDTSKRSVILNANPISIKAGESSTLSWQRENFNEGRDWSGRYFTTCNISNVGPVALSVFNTNVSPNVTTTYELECVEYREPLDVIMRPDGTYVHIAKDTATVNVEQPIIPPPTCGTASWQDGWNLFSSTSQISGTAACSIGSIDKLQEYTDPNNGKRAFYWECFNNHPEIVAKCFALKTPTVSLTPDFQNIILGNSASLKLVTENVKANSCTVNPVSFNPNVKTPELTLGNYSVSPTTDTMYRVTCTTAFDNVPHLPQTYSDTANINILESDKAFIDLRTNRSNIWVDETATLSWSGENITNCRFTRGSNILPISVSGIRLVSPSDIETYQITCDKTANAGGGTTTSPAVTITAHQPPTADLKIKKSTDSTYVNGPIMINNGEMINLKWESFNANTCSGEGFNTNNLTSGVSGNIIPPNDKTTTYGVSCWKTLPAGPLGFDTRTDEQRTKAYRSTASVSANIEYANLILIANPSNIWEGDSTTLSWTTSNVSACSIMIQGKPLYDIPNADLASGSIVQSPDSSTNYELVCLDLSNTVQSTNVNVDVFPNPEIQLNIRKSDTNFSDSSVSISKGESVDLKWLSQNILGSDQCVSNFPNHNSIQEANGFHFGLAPEESKTYTISCLVNRPNLSKRVSSDVDVYVDDEPLPEIENRGECDYEVSEGIANDESIRAVNLCSSGDVTSEPDISPSNPRQWLWVCTHENDKTCSALCPQNTIADLDSGKCIANIDIRIDKWELNPNFVDKREDKCFASWEVYVPDGVSANCLIIGDAGFSESVGINGVNHGLSPTDVYRLSCTYSSVSNLTPLTNVSNPERCVLNPEFIEF